MKLLGLEVRDYQGAFDVRMKGEFTMESVIVLLLLSSDSR